MTLINNKYRYIFIKILKTAIISLEIALSKYCDKKDLIKYPNKILNLEKL